ncbi:bacillithiol system redox-active protein YtxJ [Bacillus pinisoli]|uniref:bacillithiol system redox-active protein YtxJ n=1 Tax=Bacillus pinisoli TaxID=2901866 RepID=UPI001FF24C10|nr:bacillithiol system redox-active protein YtxJ [Bacillus pinisoli]
MKTRISTVEEFEKLVNEEHDFLFIKHSLTCPVSLAAFDEYHLFVEANSTIPTYYLYVQEDRPLSTYIADTYGVKHESPQALHFKNGEVIWNASHWKITNRSLTEALIG